MSTKTHNLTLANPTYDTEADVNASIFIINETGGTAPNFYGATVTIASNATRATVNLKGSGDTINLTGSFTDYTARISGTTLTLTSATQTISVVMSSLSTSTTSNYVLSNTLNFEDSTFILRRPAFSTGVFLSNTDDDGFALARQRLGTTAAPINSIVLSVEVAGGEPTSANGTDANEGNEVLYRLQTNGVAAGTVYNYTLSGINTNDLVDGNLTGTLVIDENGYAELAISLNEDFTSENLETMRLSVAGQTITVDVVDTSSNLPVALQSEKTDVLMGTAFNDLFLGEISPGSNSFDIGGYGYGYGGYGFEFNQRPEFRTLNNSDIIYGKLGNDELRLSVASGYAEGHINMQDVEKLSIHSTLNISNAIFGGFGTDLSLVNLDLSNATGLENIDVFGIENIDALLLNNVRDIVGLSLHGNGSYSDMFVDLNYDPEVIYGENDTQTIDVDRFRGQIQGVQGIEHYTITSSYDTQPAEFNGQERNNFISLNGEDTSEISSITINSEQNLDLNINNSNDTPSLTSIDASESTGELEINVEDANVFETYYGGFGDDDLTLIGTRADDNHTRLDEVAADSNLTDLHIELGRGDNTLYARGGLDDVFIKAGGGVNGANDTVNGLSNAGNNEITLDTEHEVILVSNNDDCGLSDYYEVENHSVGDVTIDLKFAVGTHDITINKAIYEIVGNGVNDTHVRADDTSNDLIVMTGGSTSTTNIDITGTSFDNNYMLGNYENLYIYSDEILSDINLVTGHGDQNINIQSKGDVNITVGDGSSMIKVDGFTSWTHRDADDFPTPYVNGGEDSYSVFGPSDNTFANTVTVNVGHGNEDSDDSDENIDGYTNDLDSPYTEDNAILGEGDNQFNIHANDDITINVRDYRTDKIEDNNFDGNSYDNNNNDTYVYSISDEVGEEDTGLDINLSFVASEVGDVTVNVGGVFSGTTELLNEEYDEELCDWVDLWMEDNNIDIEHTIHVDANIHASAISYTNTSNAGQSTNINMGDIVAGEINLGKVGEDNYIDINTDINTDTDIHDFTSYNGSEINIQLANSNLDAVSIQEIRNDDDSNELDINININVDNNVEVYNLEARNNSQPTFPGNGVPPSNQATIDIVGQGQQTGLIDIGNVLFSRGSDTTQDNNVEVELESDFELDINNISADGDITVTTGNLDQGDFEVGTITANVIGNLNRGFGTDLELDTDINQDININNVDSDANITFNFGSASFGEMTIGNVENGADDMYLDFQMDIDYDIEIDNVDANGNVNISVGDMTVEAISRGNIIANADSIENAWNSTSVEIDQDINLSLDVDDVNANGNVTIDSANLITQNVSLGNTNIYDSLMGDYTWGNGDPGTTRFGEDNAYRIDADINLDVDDINANHIEITGSSITLGDLNVGDVTYNYLDIPINGNFESRLYYDHNIDLNIDINDLNANEVDINLGGFVQGDVTLGDVSIQDLDTNDSNINTDENDSDSYLWLKSRVDTDYDSNIDINDIWSDGDTDIRVGGMNVGDISMGDAISEAGYVGHEVDSNLDEDIDINDITSYGDMHIEIGDYTFGDITVGYADINVITEANSSIYLNADRNVNVNIDINDINSNQNIDVVIGDISVGTILAGEEYDSNTNIEVDSNLDFNIDIQNLSTYAFDNFNLGVLAPVVTPPNRDITITTGEVTLGDTDQNGNANINTDINVDINIDNIDAAGAVSITTGGFYNLDFTDIRSEGNPNIDSNYVDININIADINAVDGLDITVNASTSLDIDLINNVGSLTSIDVYNSWDTYIRVGNEEDNITLESAWWNNINNISGNDDVGVRASYGLTSIITGGDWVASNDTFNENNGAANVYAYGGSNDTVISTTTGWDVDLRNARSDNGNTYYGYSINITGDTSNSIIWGSNEDDEITDGAGNNTLRGHGGNDTINAGAGNDTLDGGLGNDIMVGGDGNDTYYVDTTSDTITEGDGVGSGIDTVFSRATFNLGTNATNVENLTLTGPNDTTNDTDNINGTGNASDNIITGNNGNNTLDGGAGHDTIYGGNGDDTILGGTGNDILFGGLGNDTFTGGTGAEVFNIDGGVDSITDVNNDDVIKVEANGTLTSGAVLEDITVTASTYNLGSASLTSNGYDINLNEATGNKGWSVTNTGGAVTFIGSDYNDTLVAGALGDTLNGGDGEDTLTGGDGVDTLLGGSNDDTINGGAGSDLIDGGAGNDALTGGAGADTFTFSSGTNDTITDLGVGGADIIDVTNSGVTVTATAGANWTATDATNNNGNVIINSAGFTINLSADTADASSTKGYTVNATNSTGVTFTGSSRDDVLTGNAGADTLNGGNGNDTLNGGNGSDQLNGGDGDDTLTGGAGNDTLTGGSGVDTFLFSTVDLDTISSGATVTDIIADFAAADGEKIGGWGVAGSLTNYAENATAVTYSTLLSNADTALNGTVKYYVGLSSDDSSAYLVYDNDGTGVTDVIKLTGVTDLGAIDSSSIIA